MRQQNDHHKLTVVIISQYYICLFMHITYIKYTYIKLDTIPMQHQAILEHQQGVLQFSSILILSMHRQHQVPQFHSSVLQHCLPLFRCQSQVHVVTCAADQSAYKSEIPTTTNFGSNLLEQLAERNILLT